MCYCDSLIEPFNISKPNFFILITSFWIDSLISKGLIKGGSLENSLVCDEISWLNPPLRFKNEPIRHKLLDLIGDLALIGLPKAQVLVYRGSHALHAEFANAIKTACSLT